MTFTAMLREAEAAIGQKKRYAHSVRVARLADRLAQRHGVNARQARIAGVLHDLARLYSKERLMQECEERRMPIDAFERANPKVLHARLGAELARERFAVHDEAILSAIRKHTLGAAAMSPLDEVVYLADALEPGRVYHDRAELEAIAFRDLREGMSSVLQSAALVMRERGDEIAPQTLAAMEVYGCVHA